MHLSWINQECFSLKESESLDSGKPVVGQCMIFGHRSRYLSYHTKCLRYQSCAVIVAFYPMVVLQTTSNRCFSVRKMLEEGRSYRNVQQMARKEASSANAFVCSLSNPIDTHVFHPQNDIRLA